MPATSTKKLKKGESCLFGGARASGCCGLAPSDMRASQQWRQRRWSRREKTRDWPSETTLSFFSFLFVCAPTKVILTKTTHSRRSLLGAHVDDDDDDDDDGDDDDNDLGSGVEISLARALSCSLCRARSPSLRCEKASRMGFLDCFCGSR